MADFTVSNEGSIFLLTPLSAEANEWVDEHLSDEVQKFGVSVVVEHRFIWDITQGILKDGLTVENL